MTTNESRSFRIKTTVEYTRVDGTTISIPPGEHRITAVRAKGVPTGESELECWIVNENRGAAGQMYHDVDAETVAAWQKSGAVEIGGRAASER